jgi:tetratricopeptide (TPR) repeat protein
MKLFVAAAIAAITLSGCRSINNLYSSSNPYEKTVFYEKYLTATDPLDVRISQTIAALRANPNNASLHNELGQLLRVKGFPKDAETEFERAINADSTFYPAWYNLGLLRESRGNYAGARFAFSRAVRNKPGHSEALFALGLMEEQRHNTEAAIDRYAKAISINHSLLDVRVNPRIVDSRLIPRVLLRLYPTEHARQAMVFQQTPAGWVAPAQTQAPSPQPTAPQIVTPSAPVTDPSQQPPPVKPPAR